MKKLKTLDKVQFAWQELLKDGKGYELPAQQFWLLAQQYNALADTVNELIKIHNADTE